MTELLTAAQLAERLKVRPSTVREWAKTGRIPEIRISAKVRRFDAVEVDAALRRQAVSNG
jgi:excisionase family DNA binding protein